MTPATATTAQAPSSSPWDPTSSPTMFQACPYVIASSIRSEATNDDRAGEAPRRRPTATATSKVTAAAPRTTPSGIQSGSSESCSRTFAAKR